MHNDNRKKRGTSIVPRWSFFLYLFLLCYALIMTQLLRNPISAVFFWFMVVILPLSFLFLLIGKAAIQVFVMTDKQSTQKLSPVDYEIRVINSSPIPFPYVEAVMSKPREDGVRCLYQRLVLSLLPFGGYNVKNTVSFRYRGLYEIGVHEIYICDPLRLFRMRVNVNNCQGVTVYPRKLDFDRDFERSVCDIPSPHVRTFDSRDRSEVSNIREYRMGDTLKSIHWKLSSKAEELQVKDYNTNNDNHTYIFVDLSAPTTCPELKKEQARRKLKLLSKFSSPKEGEPLTLKARINLIKEEYKEKKKERRYRRRRKKGNTARDIETIDMIDALIKETSQRKSAKDKQKAQNAEAANAKEMIDKLSEIVGEDTKNVKQSELDRARMAWGGIILDEFEDEISEYCADGVIEIAIAAIRREIRDGNNCTVCWYDKRYDREMGVINVSDSAAFEEAYARFAAAPVSPEENRISNLSGIISESANITVKIITPNIDPASLSEYCAIPAMFGGAGIGCVTQVLLFNPCDKYTDPKARMEYAQSGRMDLKFSGINMVDIFESTQNDGRTVLVCNDQI